MEKTALQIFEEATEKDGLIQLLGNPNIQITNIAPCETGTTGDLVFAPNQKAFNTALANKASLIVIPKNVNTPKDLPQTALILSKNVGVAHALLKQKYLDHDYTQDGWPTIHPSAIIHESVAIPKGTRIGPNVVIEKGVSIGANCVFMANVVLEHGAIIGNKVTIHPGTIIGWNCVIGSDCLLLSNSVIGGEGFGFSQDQYFNHHRIPHTGNVVVGNQVTIGCLNTFDRGTYGATTIGNGCIFDNRCHVAHNVTIGENCIIISGFLCAGSSILGNRVVASGGTMIKDHVEICDDTYLVHRAGVIKNITQPGVYAGSPILPLKEYVKSNAIYAQLGELRQIVLALKKQLEDKKDCCDG